MSTLSKFTVSVSVACVGQEVDGLKMFTFTPNMEAVNALDQELFGFQDSPISEPEDQALLKSIRAMKAKSKAISDARAKEQMGIEFKTHGNKFKNHRNQFAEQMWNALCQFDATFSLSSEEFLEHFDKLWEGMFPSPKTKIQQDHCTVKKVHEEEKLEKPKMEDKEVSMDKSQNTHDELLQKLIKEDDNEVEKLPREFNQVEELEKMKSVMVMCEPRKMDNRLYSVGAKPILLKRDASKAVDKKQLQQMPSVDDQCVQPNVDDNMSSWKYPDDDSSLPLKSNFSEFEALELENMNKQQQ